MRPAPSRLLFAAMLFGLPAAAHAAGIETVTVTASPLGGAGIEADAVAGQVQTLSAADLARSGRADLLKGLLKNAGGVSFSAAQANPYQPDLVYRGFDASPLQGNSQGLAVYLNGVRFNQPFGDTVNFDLVPAEAISALTLEGSNPVFGLNALGGSLSLKMKTGFDSQGGGIEMSGGSYGRYGASAEYGAAHGDTAFYAAVNAEKDAGWRQHSPSRLVQGYADLGWRGTRGEMHLSLMGADTDLTGNGAAPVQLLAADRSAVFTYPDNTANRYAMAIVSAQSSVGDHWTLSGNLYGSVLNQTTRNGDASDASVCGNNAFLCLDDGSHLTGLTGTPIPNFLGGGTYAQLNETATDSTGFGGALQAMRDAHLFGRRNQLVTGVSYDAGRTTFSARSLIGALTAARGFGGPGTVIDQRGGPIEPVHTNADNDYLGLYASDILDVTDALTLTLAGRFNHADITLHDLLGTALNGDHSYDHFNPGVGAVYKLSDSMSAYAGWSMANRAPTPAELSCADASAPCSLTNFFVGDPDLKQVVAHSWEAGLRGEQDALGGRLGWSLGGWRTESDDDIQFVASEVLGRAFFRNVGRTLRQGANASAAYDGGNWSARLSYSYTDATFETPLTLASQDNPRADANGYIHVRPGDHIPGVAPHLFKLALAWQALDDLSLNADLLVAADQYLTGDEANLTPTTGSYAVVDLGGRYAITERLSVFANVTNLFNARYSTFGTFSPTADVPLAEAPGATNPRSLSPGAPRMVTGGLRLVL